MKMIVKGLLLAVAVGLVACGYLLRGKGLTGPTAQMAPVEASGYAFALDRPGAEPSGLVRAQYRGDERPGRAKAFPANEPTRVFHRREVGDWAPAEPGAGFGTIAQALGNAYKPCQNCFPYVVNLKNGTLHRAGSNDVKFMNPDNKWPLSSKDDPKVFGLCPNADCFPH
jgi:hypothetical protein